MYMFRIRHNTTSGFTLIETVVAIGLFLILIYGIYLSYANILESLTHAQLRVDATSLIEDELEVVRNMPYQDVGIQGGYPSGKLQAQKNIVLGGVVFTLSTTVRSIDDPFDGLAGGAPNDTAPADYKLVEIETRCDFCPGFVPVVMTGQVSPRGGLETTTNNGSLFVNVFDAFGEPVSGATVHVVNTALNPTIDITDVTNLSGVLQLVDIPTSTSAYQVSVSKSGYSSEKTYALGDPQNQNPLTPHATIASQQVTSLSFAIDRVSALTLRTLTDMCVPVSSASFLHEGTKLIGEDPNVLKYSTSVITNAQGALTISNLEWDTYSLSDTTAAYDISGTRPLFPLGLNPATTTPVFITMAPTQASGLLVTVKDGGGNPLRDATVTLTRTGFSDTVITGRRTLTQTDWSGGGYSSQSGGIDDSVPGSLSLVFASSTYPTSTEFIISNTFNVGTSSGALFYDFSWNPSSQPPATGVDSLRFQVAANNDDATWDFLGPDGTSATFYTSSSASLYGGHANNRYFRYKAFFETDDPAVSPTLSDVSFAISSFCVPPGQAFFNNLSVATYTLTIQKPGYQTFTDSAVSVSGSWQEYIATLVP